MNFKLSAPIVQWSDFMEPELLQLARHTALVNKDKFVQTTVTSGEPDYRSSVVLWDHFYPDFYSKFRARVESLLPQVVDMMGDYVPKAQHTHIELQITNSFRNGDHFDKHIDNGSAKDEKADTAKRRITFVNYFHIHEGDRRYSGGELLIHFHNGDKIVQPVTNSVVFFPSHLYHTVMPIHSPSERFEDGRYTANGWVWA